MFGFTMVMKNAMLMIILDEYFGPTMMIILDEFVEMPRTIAPLKYLDAEKKQIQQE